MAKKTFSVQIVMSVPQTFYINGVVEIEAKSAEEALDKASKLSGKEIAKLSDEGQLSVDEELEFDFNGIYEAISDGRVKEVEPISNDPEACVRESEE